ncbi:methyltransferase [Leucobacter luti]|uniref:Methyltransferase family protein n=1 Tax=Leucobacter luti TaxID=340320 RepID=A0A4Q7TYD6_9MICO|nr:class I SAM-dependent methyltransferase [Leucobacter luti]MBL3698843.1 class I SAM-dependent methyltransferase [Leucobacter luti]RZT66221.1 methyltransferase family protein [Leucobacter luti]
MRWDAAGAAESALWWSANGRPAPKRVVPVDDRLTADQAVKYAAQGTAMLWLGDFHNAKQLIGAVDRRLSREKKKPAARAPLSDAEEFYRIRQARAQRSRMLSLILVPLEADAAGRGVVLPLPRAPRVAEAVAFAYGGRPGAVRAVVSLQELTGVLSAHQWYLNGVDVPSLGARIHPHYGTFLPTRHEYVDLVAGAPLPAESLAFDIGTGTGVLAAVLAKRGVSRVVGTDIHQRAVDCANDNFTRLGIREIATAQRTSMFPEGRAPLIVCNPPWLPGSATTTLDAAVYDPGSAMLLQFLAGLPAHLTEGGEGWLVLSDLAELLGLRSRQLLLDAVAGAGLRVVDRIDTVPTHRRASDADDLLHAARSREVTSLWRLRVGA